MGTGKNRRIISAFVVVCSEGLVVRKEPPPANAMGSNNWSAKCSSTGTSALEPCLGGFDCRFGDFLCGPAALAKAGEDRGHVLGFDFQDYRVAGPHWVRNILDAAFIGPPLQFLPHDRQFPFGHVLRELGGPNAGTPASNRTPLEQIDRGQFRCRLHPRVKFAATCRKESRALQFQLYRRPHPLNQRHEALRQEIERGRQRIVGPAFQCERAGAGGGQQRGKHRLQHQRGAAGGAHGKAVIARRHRTRANLKCLRVSAGSR